jgi:hypothetical protein
VHHRRAPSTSPTPGTAPAPFRRRHAIPVAALDSPGKIMTAYMPRPRVLTLALAGLLLAPRVPRAQEPVAMTGPGLGTLRFPVTTNVPAARVAFARGALLLHLLQYPDAAHAFRAAEQLDPSFAMAYWGEAMTHTHPASTSKTCRPAAPRSRSSRPTPRRGPPRPTPRESEPTSRRSSSCTAPGRRRTAIRSIQAPWDASCMHTRRRRGQAVLCALAPRLEPRGAQRRNVAPGRGQHYPTNRSLGHGWTQVSPFEHLHPLVS